MFWRDKKLEAEQAVLGALMLNSKSWLDVGTRLSQSDFHSTKHQVIFLGIQSLCEQNTPVDLITLTDWLKRHNQLDIAGGLGYLGQLVNNTPSAANIIAYADIVYEQSLLRRLTQVGEQIIKSATNPNELNGGELLNQAEQLVSKVTQSHQCHGGLVKVDNLLAKALSHIDLLASQERGLVGISTGFAELDQITSGLQSSDLIIVAGRPSMGKTAFSMNIAGYVATQLSLPVAIFNMEMSSEQLIMRLISSLARVELQRIRTGQITDVEWDKVTTASTYLVDAPLFIDDTPTLSPAELRTKLRRLTQSEGQLGLVVVDYLQLMQSSTVRENRVAEVTEISRSLKAAAKELRVPLIALSLLNRGLEQRPNKRPKMADLRDSGSIEQDADLILFVYRDEVYNEESKDKGIAEIIIAKQRNGPVGCVQLIFEGQYTQFSDVNGIGSIGGSSCTSRPTPF